MHVLYFLHYHDFPFQQQLNVKCISFWHTFSEEDNIKILFRVSPERAVGLTLLKLLPELPTVRHRSDFFQNFPWCPFLLPREDHLGSPEEFGYNLAFSWELSQLNRGQKAGLKTTTERCCSLAQTWSVSSLTSALFFGETVEFTV